VYKRQLVNSGSSANLLAVSALTSPKLGDRRLKPGDEVITVAACFPTTVNPILQNRLVPVFLDVTLPAYEIDVSQLEAARSEKTGAIFIAHTPVSYTHLDVYKRQIPPASTSTHTTRKRMRRSRKMRRTISNGGNSAKQA